MNQTDTTTLILTPEETDIARSMDLEGYSITEIVEELGLDGYPDARRAVCVALLFNVF